MTFLSRLADIGTRVIDPKAEGYGARIGDLWVRLAASSEFPLRYYTKDSLAPRIDQRGQTDANVLDLGYAWARTELDGGEGLDWSPRSIPVNESVTANDVPRFWDSSNLDVSAPAAGDQYTLKLTKQYELFDETVLKAVADIGASANFVFVADDSTVYWYDDWQAASLVGSVVLSSAVTMLAVSAGDQVAAVTDDGSVHLREPGALTFTEIYTAGGANEPVSAIWFVKGRFVAFRQNAAGIFGELGELAPDGTFVTFDTTGVYTVPSVVSSGVAIVAAVTDGTVRSYVPEQSNQLDPTTVNLVIRGRTDLPKGEIPSVLGGTVGVLTILTIASETDGTTTRFYRAEVLDSRFNYIVGQLQLLREWFSTGESVDVIANMSTTRDALFFTITEDDNESHVWRFDLVTLGLSRYATAFTGTGNATTLFAGTIAVLNPASGNVWIESDLYQSTGYLISPNITFGLNTDIAWIATMVEAIQVSGSGAQVELYRSIDPEAILDPNHLSWQLIQRVSNSSQSGVEQPLLNTKSRTLALQLRFTPSSGGLETPLVTRTAVRGIPTHRDWIVNLPVNVSDSVEVHGRAPLHISGLGDTLQVQMLNLVGNHVELVVLDPPMTFRGVIDNVEQPVRYLSQRGSVTTVLIVQFRGSRATSTIFPTGDAGLGIGLLGVANMGIGQTGIGA